VGFSHSDRRKTPSRICGHLSTRICRDCFVNRPACLNQVSFVSAQKVRLRLTFSLLVPPDYELRPVQLRKSCQRPRLRVFRACPRRQPSSCDHGRCILESAARRSSIKERLCTGDLKTHPLRHLRADTLDLLSLFPRLDAVRDVCSNLDQNRLTTSSYRLGTYSARYLLPSGKIL
jgi:hypothetical protein